MSLNKPRDTLFKTFMARKQCTSKNKKLTIIRKISNYDTETKNNDNYLKKIVIIDIQHIFRI